MVGQRSISGIPDGHLTTSLGVILACPGMDFSMVSLVGIDGQCTSPDQPHSSVPIRVTGDRLGHSTDELTWPRKRVTKRISPRTMRGRIGRSTPISKYRGYSVEHIGRSRHLSTQSAWSGGEIAGPQPESKSSERTVLPNIK